MSDHAVKAVSFGPAGTIQPPSSSNWQTVEFTSGVAPGPDSFYFMSGAVDTPWAKIWVDPISLWPNQAAPDPARLAQLDHEIALAKFAGWRVILTVNLNFPDWINHVPGQSADPARLPAPGLGNPFSVFVWFLALRYNQFNPARPEGGYSWVDVIEPLNEPNALASGDAATNANTTADLMLTAKQVVALTSNSPIVAGPATADNYGSSAASYDNFTILVLVRLEANGFYHQPNNHVFVWSQHNYGDMYYDLGTGSGYHGSNVVPGGPPVGDINKTRVQQTRALLVTGGWRGWPDGGAVPYIFLTEGGVRPINVALHWTASSGLLGSGGQDGQAILLNNNWTRMRNNTDGLNVVLGTQYLWYDTVAGDYTGLLTKPVPFTTRSAYYVWEIEPSG